MNRFQVSAVAVVIACGPAVYAVLAQRGVGELQGVARQVAKPKVVSLSGEVVEVKTGSCKMTTGRSPAGTHFVMKTSGGTTLEVHLGPAAAVEFLAKELPPGTEVKVEAFRTKKMARGQYVARSLKYGARTVQLRDETLRPAWAGQGGPGRWAGRRGRGPPWPVSSTSGAFLPILGRDPDECGPHRGGPSAPARVQE